MGAQREEQAMLLWLVRGIVFALHYPVSVPFESQYTWMRSFPLTVCVILLEHAMARRSQAALPRPMPTLDDRLPQPLDRWKAYQANFHCSDVELYELQRWETRRYLSIVNSVPIPTRQWNGLLFFKDGPERIEWIRGGRASRYSMIKGGVRFEATRRWRGKGVCTRRRCA